MKRMYMFIFMVVSFMLSATTLEEWSYLNLIEDPTIKYLTEEMCNRYDIPVEYVVRLMYVESTLGKDTFRLESNGTFSAGIMQINSVNEKPFEDMFFDLEDVEYNIFNDYVNVYIGCQYLDHLYNELGNWEETFIAYNAGIGNLNRGTAPECSYDYSVFIMTGRVSPDSHLYKKSLQFNTLLIENKVDNMIYCALR